MQLCQNRQLTDIEINHYAAECGILPDRAKTLYQKRCHPKHDVTAALNLVAKVDKRAYRVCSNLDSNVKILKRSFQPYCSIYKNVTKLIDCVNWFADQEQ